MAAANNNESSKKAINREYTDFMYGVYLDNYWLIQVGYKASSESIVEKTLMDWEEISDCNNELCTRSKTESIAPTILMSSANFNRESIFIPLCAHRKSNHFNPSQGDCRIFEGNCGCSSIWRNCCANAPYNFAYNSPFVIWSSTI